MVRRPFFDLSTRPPQNYYLGPSSKSVHELDGPSSKIRPPQNYNLCPVSESVHEMGGLSPNFGAVSTWTGERMDGPQTAVFVRGVLVGSTLLIYKHFEY